MKKDNLREKVAEKTNGHCAYCEIELPKRWHIDHIKPLRRNPDGTCENPENENFENLIPSCPSCNILKSSLPLESFRNKVANFIISLNRDSTIYRVAKKYGLVEETEKEVKFYFEK